MHRTRTKQIHNLSGMGGKLMSHVWKMSRPLHVNDNLHSPKELQLSTRNRRWTVARL